MAKRPRLPARSGGGPADKNDFPVRADAPRYTDRRVYEQGTLIRVGRTWSYPYRSSRVAGSGLGGEVKKRAGAALEFHVIKGGT